ncbi:MAG: hypothetical protein HOV83_21290 [Catenulispora sp.]|nr:hypothetical protein [Catenulispora sp.]
MTGNEFRDGLGDGFESRIEDEVRAMFAERSQDIRTATSPYRAVRQRIALARRKRRQRIGGAGAAFAVAAVGIGVWLTAPGGPDSAPRPGSPASTKQPAVTARFVYGDGSTELPAGPLHDAAEAYLREHYSDGLSGGTVVTTFDQAMQHTAEQLESANTIGLAALDPRTGDVKALVGSWNQPAPIADTIKPITLATAFETGHYTPDSTEPANADKHPLYLPPTAKQPLTYVDPQTKAHRNWPPERGGGTVSGDPLVTLRQATMDASNTPFAQLELAQDVTVKGVLEKAKAMGIPADAPSLAAVPSLTLGMAEASPLTMASVYGVFADGGVRNTPVMVSAVKDAKGAVVWRPSRHGDQVLPPETADQVTDVLRGTLTHGSASDSAQQRALGARGLAGMAGTESTDIAAWFDGYSPNLVTAVNLTRTLGSNRLGALAGGENGRTVDGSTDVAPLWAQFMAGFEY